MQGILACIGGMLLVGFGYAFQFPLVRRQRGVGSAACRDLG